MSDHLFRIINRKNKVVADLAKNLGISQEYLKRIVSKEVTPTVPLAMRISEALGVRMEELFNFD